MIFYFSGSGNSYYAANVIAEKLDTPLISMAKCLQSSKLDFDARHDKYCGFVFPVHFWGVPYLVTEFIKNINMKLTSDTYVFAVYTCGGGAGNTSKMIEKLLKKSGITLSSVFSIKQIDIFDPLFKIPPKDKQEEVILKSNIELENIIKHIQNLDKGDYDENKGTLPFLATSILYPFYSYYRNTYKFRVSDLCTACKKCESICPLKIIEIKDNKPIWKQKKCTLCFACMHICPAQAINYGNVLFFFDSKNKGRYRNPYAPKSY